MSHSNAILKGYFKLSQGIFNHFCSYLLKIEIFYLGDPLYHLFYISRFASLPSKWYWRNKRSVCLGHDFIQRHLSNNLVIITSKSDHPCKRDCKPEINIFFCQINTARKKMNIPSQSISIMFLFFLQNF